MDGINVRGTVLLVETPHSLTLATLKGDLSPSTCSTCAATRHSALRG